MDKKYYWLKLKKDFFKRHDIKIVESMPNGKDYILFYLKLLLESISHEGNLRFSETIPYNDEMLSVITCTNVDIVRSAMKIFIELNMIERLDDATIFMSEVQTMIGSEAWSTDRVRRFREKKEKEKENVTLALQNVTCNEELEKDIDIDIDIDKEKDIIISSKDEKNWKNDFETYQKELRAAWKKIITPDYVKEREKFHPNLDILLTLEKACKDYWITEAGWKHKKQKRVKEINWESTFNNSLTLKSNQVYKNTQFTKNPF